MYIYFVYLLIILILVLNYGAIVDCYRKKEKENVFWLFVTTTVTNIFVGWLILVVISYYSESHKVPSAIDVYRGLTELEIHSINDIPQDTIVIFKKTF